MNPSINRRTLLATSAAMAAASVLPGARSQGSWPVTVVVPFAPGGAGNGSVRILAEIDQPLVVENRAGG